MRRWKPQLSGRFWLGLIFFLVSLVGAIFLLTQVVLSLLNPPEQWQINTDFYFRSVAGVLLLLIAGTIGYRVVGALTLSYGVDRNGFYIFWLGNRAIVPLAQIESIESGIVLPETLGSLAHSLGYYHGRVRLPEGRIVHRFTTKALAQSLILHTTVDSYAISPQEVEAFVQELEQRRRLGAIQQLSTGVEVGRMFFYAYWEDLVIRRALMVALILNALLFGWLSIIYPELPGQIFLRADAVGEAGALVPRHQILFLPLAGMTLLLLNTGLGMTSYSRDPLGSRVLQVASVVVQILLGVAILTIVS